MVLPILTHNRVASWQFYPLGDTALLAQAPADDPVANQVALSLARRLEANPPPGFIAAVPAIDTLLVCFEPLLSSHAALAAHLLTLLADPAPPMHTAGRLIEVPVRYGGDHGPDLETVAAQLGLSPAEGVALHSDRPWRPPPGPTPAPSSHPAQCGARWLGGDRRRDDWDLPRAAARRLAPDRPDRDRAF